MQRRHPARTARARAVAPALAALFALAAGAAPAGAPAASGAPAPERVVLPDDVVPRRYDIEIRPQPQRLSFAGSVRVRVDVARPTSRVTLNAAGLAVDAVALDGRRADPKIARDAGRQELTLRFAEPLSSGEHTLSIEYRGRIEQAPAGLFAVDYDTQRGRRRALYTQFEAGDARRFVPCWDQPDRKAVFALSAVVPSGLMAVSNTPVDRTAPMPGGLKRVSFAPTPRMSSYLLFFALGEFERSHRRVAGVDLGVISRRGDAAMAGFALDAAAQVLPYFNDYFGARYPLPKLDLVAVPAGRSFGAMENWGAITFPDAWLLLDARVSTESDRREVYDTIAHEIAHQWFGNLVTMAWWDDLWLNEGFATWMARKVTAHLHPEWDVWLLSEPLRRAAMIEDAGAGTHAVVTPIRDARQADNAAFDAITYDKGAAVVRMIESYVGEEAFRSGVRAYLARYAHASTVSADLWRELGAASSLPVDRIASDFTQQAGVPMIDVDEADGVVTLSQRRFGIDAEARAQPSWARSWHVPVAALDGEGQVQHAIVSAPQPVTLPAAQALLVNSGQAGYFVSRYAPEPFRRLLQRLPTLPAGDQLGLFSDTSALARAGYVPMASMLDLVAALPADGAAALWSTVCQDLVRLGRRYGEGAPARAYRAWLRTRLQAVLARVGWEPQGGESGNAPQLRAALLTALAEADDEGVIAEARRRFDRLAVAPDALVGDQRDTVLAIVALHADAAAWERLRAMARATKPGPEREQMYRVLGSARDAALAQRTLQLIVSGEAPRAAAADILLMVGERHPAATFDFVASQWSRIAPMLTPSFASGLAPRIAAGSDEPETAERLSDFARRVGPACDPDEVRKAVATIHFLASIKRERLTEVDRWLGDHAS